MDFTVCCIVAVFQCLNLFDRCDCEQVNSRVRNGRLLSLRFDRTMENIHRVGEKSRSTRDINGNSHVSSPVQCHLRYPHSPTLPHPPPLSQPTHSLSMPVQDRTNEFRACVESIRNRSTISSRNSEQKQRLLHGQAKDSPKTEFTRLASAIAKDINTTTIRLGKLAQRERTPPASISPLLTEGSSC